MLNAKKCSNLADGAVCCELLSDEECLMTAKSSNVILVDAMGWLIKG
jgi:hypothetical protein